MQILSILLKPISFPNRYCINLLFRELGEYPCNDDRHARLKKNTVVFAAVKNDF